MYVGVGGPMVCRVEANGLYFRVSSNGYWGKLQMSFFVLRVSTRRGPGTCSMEIIVS
jgi:hypothetical protein